MTLLYHVTTAQAAQSIRSSGVDPAFSRGKRRRAWFVTADRLPWVLAHVSARTGVPVSLLHVFMLDVCQRTMRRWSLQGVYYTEAVQTVILGEDVATTEYVDNLIGAVQEDE